MRQAQYGRETVFTGIVEQTGSIIRSDRIPEGESLHVKVGGIAPECELGSSVAIDGVCLTVAAKDRESLRFDVIHETLKRSTLGRKKVGDKVNVERALRLGDRIDGHFVQGHIDGKARVVRIDLAAGAHVVWFEPDAELMPFIIEKGSIAIAGVSLTVAATSSKSFSVAVIPTTLERTTFTELKTGDQVNVETDILSRTIVRHISSITQGLTLDQLRVEGFAT